MMRRVGGLPVLISASAICLVWILPYPIHVKLKEWCPVGLVVLGYLLLRQNNAGNRIETPPRVSSAVIPLDTCVFVLSSALVVCEFQIRRYEPVTNAFAHINITFDRVLPENRFILEACSLGFGEKVYHDRGYRWWLTYESHTISIVRRNGVPVTSIGIKLNNAGVGFCPYLNELSAVWFSDQVKVAVPQCLILRHEDNVRNVQLSMLLSLNGQIVQSGSQEVDIEPLGANEYSAVPIPIETKPRRRWYDRFIAR